MVAKSNLVGEASRLYDEAGTLEAEKVLNEEKAAEFQEEYDQLIDRLSKVKIERDYQLQLASEKYIKSQKLRKRADKMRKKAMKHG